MSDRREHGRMSSGLGVLILILITAVIVAGCSSPSENKFMVFQSLGCPCCEEYTGYLTEQGFQVETTYIQDMTSIKKKHQIPQNMESGYRRLLC